MSKQYYWNKQNFEGLALITAQLKDDVRLESLAQYCLLREKGLRNQALSKLEDFLKEMNSRDVKSRREVTLKILDVHRAHREVHQFLTDPLQKRLLEPVLAEWLNAEPDAAMPLRSLALLRHDLDLMRKALGLNPGDQEVRIALIGMLLYWAGNATHHLVEGVFIGKVEEAEADLAEATELQKGVQDPTVANGVNEDCQALGTLLADWREYGKAPKGSFVEWCREKGSNHHWSRAYYYNP